MSTKPSHSTDSATPGERRAALSEPATALSEPATALSEPATALSEPATALSEPAAALSEDATTLSEPAAALGEDATTLSEPATALSEPATALGEHPAVSPETTTDPHPNSATMAELPAAFPVPVMPDDAQADAGTHLPTVSVTSPGRDLSAYITTVNNVAILTPEQELQLTRQYYYDNDVDAARQLVMAHLRFVVHMAKTYAGYGLPLGDLIQEGNVGLMKAVKRFNPEVGVRLVSFAVHWIKAEMHEYIIRNWRIVRISTTKAQRKLFFNLRSSKKRLGWLNNEEAAAVAKELGVDPKVVRQMEGRLSAYDTAFDAEPDADADNLYKTPAYYLEDQNSNLERTLARTERNELINTSLHDALAKLDDRSRDILHSRWLADDKATLIDLAAKYDVSAERIRQLEKAAMNKVKGALNRELVAEAIADQD